MGHESIAAIASVRSHRARMRARMRARLVAGPAAVYIGAHCRLRAPAHRPP